MPRLPLTVRASAEHGSRAEPSRSPDAPPLLGPCRPHFRILRHFFRHNPDRDSRVAACDRQALPLAQMLLDRGWQHALSPEQHVFALMPLRHTPR